jgi:hypothetical protein
MDAVLPCQRNLVVEVRISTVLLFVLLLASFGQESCGDSR